MGRAARVAIALGAVALALPALGIAALYAIISHPSQQDLPMPAGLIGLDTPDGLALLADADAVADHGPLIGAFQTQEKGTWCGVASAVTVLNALGSGLDQDGFFTPAARAVRPRWRTTFGGMPIADLAGMVEAHGAAATAVHADESSVEAFRTALAANLAAPDDFLIVNYDRRVLGEEGGGHISPVSAWDADSDHLLLLDVASYKYPPHWVAVSAMFDAMDTPDSESGRSRGWVEVRR